MADLEAVIKPEIERLVSKWAANPIDYYGVLGLKPGASRDDICAAYVAALKQGMEVSLAQEAWDTLFNRFSRTAYDSWKNYPKDQGRSKPTAAMVRRSRQVRRWFIVAIILWLAVCSPLAYNVLITEHGWNHWGGYLLVGVLSVLPFLVFGFILYSVYKGATDPEEAARDVRPDATVSLFWIDPTPGQARLEIVYKAKNGTKRLLMDSLEAKTTPKGKRVVVLKRYWTPLPLGFGWERGGRDTKITISVDSVMSLTPR
jgi:hypothetical protein